MKPTTMKRLTMATVALVVIGFALTALDRPSRTEASDGSLLFPKLSKRLNDVAKVTVETTEGLSTLVRQDERWGLENRHAYPVQMGSLRSLLLELAQAEVLDEKTDNPEFYERLGVQEMGTGETPNREVRLYNAKGKEMAALIIGERREGGGATSSYVREPDEERSLLVKAKLQVPGTTTGWLEPTIVAIEPKRVQSVELRHADGEVLTLSRTSPAERNLELLNLPEGKKLKYAHISSSLREALRNFNLRDVTPAADVEIPAESEVRAVFWTFEGLEVTIDLWTVETPGEGDAEPTETSYVQVRAAENPSPHGISIATEGDEGEGTALEGTAPVDAAAEAATINARGNGWVYEISPFAKGNLTKRMDDLVEDDPDFGKEEPEEVAAEVDATEDDATEDVAEDAAAETEAPATEAPAAATPRSTGEPISSRSFEDGELGPGAVTTGPVVSTPEGASAPAADEPTAKPETAGPDAISNLDFEDGSAEKDGMKAHGLKSAE